MSMVKDVILSFTVRDNTKNAIFALFWRRLGVNDNVQGLCLCHKYLIVSSAPSVSNKHLRHLPAAAHFQSENNAKNHTSLCCRNLWNSLFHFFPTVLNNPLVHMSVNLSSFTLSRPVWTRLMWLVLTKGPLPPDNKHEYCLEKNATDS